MRRIDSFTLDEKTDLSRLIEIEQLDARDLRQAAADREPVIRINACEGSDKDHDRHLNSQCGFPSQPADDSSSASSHKVS